MDLLNAMRNFTAVVDAGSFSQAAAQRRLSNATISQSIKNLEDHLGVRLLNRNTRCVTLTDEGMLYEHRCRAALAEIEEIQQQLLGGRERVSGRLRVEMPYALGKSFVLPRLGEFIDAFPEVELTVLLNPVSGRVVEEGIDVAIQLGAIPSSALIARRIHTTRHLACATPGYLRNHCAPSQPGELEAHRCIGFWSQHTHRMLEWTFERDKTRIVHKPAGPLHFNSSEAVIEAAYRDLGIIYLPDLLVHDDLRTGRLTALLDGWTTLERPVYVVFPEKRHLPAKVRAFADFVAGIFADLAF